MTKTNKSIFKTLGKIFKVILVTVVVFVTVNIVYLIFEYKRIPDNQELDINLAKDFNSET
ncbi:MAG: hypothetical protein Q4F54_02970 [Coriobacteriia bacterium]|nr:hypothetical protein [Coriobacteriia bacterium]